MDLQEFKEIFNGSTVYFYMSTDGLTIWSSSDPIAPEGSCTLTLHTEIDNTDNKRKYPELGDRLDNYHVNRETGDWHTTPSHWIVWRVEAFHSADENQVMREVVIVWCKKEPVAEN